MRLWYYNKAKDTKAKDRAIEALKYIVSQNLGNQGQSMLQPQQPQMEWWFPWQDQMSMQWFNQPTAKQPKIENPLTQAESENQLLQVNWMQSI